MNTNDFRTKAAALHGTTLDFSHAEYAGTKVRLRVVCSAHGEFLAFPYNVLAGSGCGPCKVEAGRAAAAAKFRADFAVAHGDSLVLGSTPYVNSRTHVTVACPDHGDFTASPSNLLAGKGCPKCGNAARGAKSRARSPLYVAGAWERAAREVHGDKYAYPHEFRGYHDDNTIVCPTHGAFVQTGSNHLTGHGCTECRHAAHRTRCHAEAATAGALFVTKAREVHGGRYTYEAVVYETALRPVLITCPSHGTFEQTPNSHLCGTGCARCTHRVSKAETEIAAFLEQHGLVVERQRRFGKMSVDLWVPSNGIAIEHHGEWFHRDRVNAGDGAAPRRPSLHREKLEAVQAEGGRLIQLWGTDWAHRRQQCERLLLAAFGLDKTPALGARKCEVTRPTREQASTFYREHHIRGWETGPAHFVGLVHGDTLVAVAAFTVQARGVELARFATSQRVPGACGRLVAWARTTWPGRTLFSFSDNMLSDGKMYAALGFIKTNVGDPNYYMWQNNGNRLWHRRLFRHTTIDAWQAKHAPTKPCTGTTCREKEESMGVWRVWDAGVTRWELAP